MKRLILVLIACLFVGGCAGDVVRSKVEKGIANALPEYLGPAKEYKVRVDGSAQGLVGGKLKRLYIEGTDVQLDPNLIVRYLYVEMDDVKFDTGSRELKSVSGTSFQATVAEAAVNRYLHETRDSNAEMTVSLQPGKINVSLIPRFLGIDVLVAIAGRLVLAGGDKVNFLPDNTAVAHLKMPGFAVNKVMDRVNPVLDMSVMKFPVTLQDIRVKKGAVVIKGRANFDPQKR